MRLVLITLALISIFSEAFKIGNIDAILRHCELSKKIDSMGEGKLKALLQSNIRDSQFQNPVLLVATITDAIYSIFTIVLLMTNKWYVGLVLIIMTVIQAKFFKYKKKTIIIDSIMCILLLTTYIVLL